jgi:acyl transferase domain-containing protein
MRSVAPTAWTDDAIAVIGLAGRFPGASTPDALWANVAAGVESIRILTSDQLLAAGVRPELLSDAAYVKAAAPLEDVARFDAGFFGFNPRDAAILDPQHRHFLECAWEALEDAGHVPERFRGAIGVYAGCGMNGYFMFNLLTNPQLVDSVGLFLLRHTGNDKDFLTTRVSYLLGLTGPSLGVQTACSTSLVAVHLACQQLLNGECDMALAGGVTIEMPHGVGYRYEAGEILSPDGHCRAFDAAAQGTVFGSGVGVVVLRRAADAVADGDHIYALIKGSAVNNDGGGKVGYLAPSVDGQAAAVREALGVAGISADAIGYVEAHGTGTPVGDPIEIAALTQAFRGSTDRRGYCAIGSVKTNIGHLDTAAGVAGLIKAAKALQYRQLPPSLHFTQPNPAIDFAASPFYVNTELRDWPEPASGRRCAAVNSLGVGGTNAHVILEEAPARDPMPSAGEHLLVLSARTPTALQRMRFDLAEALGRPGAPPLGDVAYTLQVGRRRHRQRWSAVCSSHEEAVRLLLDGGASSAAAAEPAAPVVFLFPGGGVQYPNMGRGLYDSEPVFRKAVDQCLTTLRDRHGVDLADALFPDQASVDQAARVLARSTPSILSTFTIELALARLLMSWQILPAAMSGHSLGEYVAACLAGVFTLDDALSIVKARGDVFERLPRGSMLNVQWPEDRVVPYLRGQLSIAAVNSPVSCVVSGPHAEILELSDRLRASGAEIQPLHIDVAAHSPMLEPFLDEFRRVVGAVRLNDPAIPFISNVTGRWMTAADATDPAYWVRHLRQTVRFGAGLATLLSDPSQVLLEVGPGRALASLARQQPAKPRGVVTSLRHPTEPLSDRRALLTAVGRIWELGNEPDWLASRGGQPGHRVGLPTYPFERQQHWIQADGGVQAAAAAVAAADGPATVRGVAEWFHTPRWTVAPPSETAVLPSVGDIIVFCDPGGLAGDVASRLRVGTSGRIVLVEAGPRFAQVEADRFTVSPLSDADHAALFAALGEDLRSVSHVVYGWTLPRLAASEDGIDDALDRHFFAPLAFAQGLARHELDRAVDVMFLTQGVAQIAGEATMVPAAATLLGPSRVTSREIGRVTTRVVDLMLPDAPRQREQLAALLAAEARCAAPQSLVAYRGQTRWVEAFVREPLSASSEVGLRDQGVYVITGGLGGLGLEVATFLARTCRARLVLVGRTALPPRAEWDAWLAGHAADDATAVRIRRVRQCEALGAHVLLATADVADAARLAVVRQQAIEAFGAIHGIVHAAGVLDDGLIALKTREAAGAVLRPKVQGTLALHKVFAPDALDFLLLFSSVSAILGLEGQADYTAASAFLDAFASSATASGTRTVSIGWGPWRDVGLAVASAHRRRGGDGRSASHPWFDRVREQPSGEVSIGLRLAGERPWMLAEHMTIDGDPVLPGAGYLELARAALAEIGRPGTVEVADLLLQRPILAPPGQAPEIEIRLEPDEHGYRASWCVGEEVYATALVWASELRPTRQLDIPLVRARCVASVSEPEGSIDQPFMRFGPRWANLRRIGYGDREALLDLSLPAAFTTDPDRFLLHPALLDMATAGAQALIPGFDRQRDFYVPFSYGHLRMYRGLPPSVVSHVRLSAGTDGDTAVFDATITDGAGAVLVELTDFCMRRVAAPVGLTTASGLGADKATAQAAPLVTAKTVADELMRHGIGVDSGLEALSRVLGSSIAPRVVVSPVSPGWWLERIDAAGRAQELKPPTLGPLDHLPAFDGITSAIATMWQDLLGVTPNALESEFFALGGQSLSAIRLANRIGRHFKTPLPVAAVFEHPSLGAMSALVRTALREPSPRVDGDPDAAAPPLVAVPRDSFRMSLTELSVEPTHKLHDQ